MFELHYRGPENLRKESVPSKYVSRMVGRLSYRELPGLNCENVVLTYDFDDPENAERAAEKLISQDEHI